MEHNFKSNQMLQCQRQAYKIPLYERKHLYLYNHNFALLALFLKISQVELTAPNWSRARIGWGNHNSEASSYFKRNNPDTIASKWYSEEAELQI